MSANLALEKAKSKETRIKVEKEEMDEVITVKQERVEETETLPKGWKSQGEEKRFASMVAAVEWMIQNKATSDQIYQVGEGCMIKFFLLLSLFYQKQHLKESDSQ